MIGMRAEKCSQNLAIFRSLRAAKVYRRSLVMISPAGHWHEGMFMRPQLFQAAERYLLDQMQRSHHWDVHYGWGLRSFELDLDALRHQRLVIRKLEARLPSGTLVSIPADGRLAEVPIKAALRRTNPLMVYLAVAALSENRANTSTGPSGDYRYRIETQELLDENSGRSPQPISIRRLNWRLLVGDEDQAGFETLPLARVVTSEGADASPQLDTTYIPPLLS